MRKKQFTKKLTFKKSAVANLNQVKGGVAKTTFHPIELSKDVAVICASEYEICKPKSQFCTNGYNICVESQDLPRAP